MMFSRIGLPDTPPANARLELAVLSPVSGRPDDLTAHQDPLVCHEIVGPGRLIHTSSHLICAPVAGKLLACEPLTYSFQITTREGLKLRVSYGNDMTRFMGEKCEFLQKAQSDIAPGEPVIRLNTAWLRHQQVSPICIVNVLNASQLKALVPVQARHTSASQDTLFTVYA